MSVAKSRRKDDAWRDSGIDEVGAALDAV